jgi:hypothetical protein
MPQKIDFPSVQQILSAVHPDGYDAALLVWGLQGHASDPDFADGVWLECMPRSDGAMDLRMAFSKNAQLWLDCRFRVTKGDGLDLAQRLSSCRIAGPLVAGSTVEPTREEIVSRLERSLELAKWSAERCAPLIALNFEQMDDVFKYLLEERTSAKQVLAIADAKQAMFGIAPVSLRDYDGAVARLPTELRAELRAPSLAETLVEAEADRQRSSADSTRRAARP